MAKKTEELPLFMQRSGIQDSYCYKGLNSAREIAEKLVDEKGQLHPWKRPLPYLYDPAGTSDGAIHDHQLNFLRRWDSDPGFVNKFRKFSLPLCHSKAEEMVRATLLMPWTARVTDGDIRRAVVSACLTPLRQTVGSCFATAPAILAQRHHLDLFVDDLYELLTAGRLRRIVGGVQYTVPLSLSFGVGDLRNKIDPSLEFWLSPGLMAALEAADLIPKEAEHKDLRAKDLLALHSGMTVEALLKKTIPSTKLDRALIFFKATVDNALLKAWEFTIASFSDIKMEFSKWNLSYSLGLHHKEKGGIGEAVYEAIEIHLKEANQKADTYHEETLVAFDQFKAAESILKNASSEAQAHRAKAELQARLHHLRVCEEMRAEFQERAKILGRFFAFLINHYIAKFQEYFQEIYDPEMPELYTGPYEDRMAGFRLVYKHGRHDSSLWTLIQGPEEFVRSLVDFFTLTEPIIAQECNEREKKILEELTTAVILHVRTDFFLQTAMARTGKLGRLPWSYISGGTMDQLVPIYFKTSISRESREVQDELDLFVFFLETLKSLPQTERFEKDPSQRLLIESATHAFSLLPGLQFFKEGWRDNGFTYTWIRDQFLLPGKEFYSGMKLTSDQQEEIYRRLGIEGEIFSSISLEAFCAQIAKIPQHELAAFLYRTLPLISAAECKSVLQKLLGKSIELPSEIPPFLSSQEIQTLAKVQIRDDVDRHAVIAEKAKMLKLAPKSCLFADTNWSQGYFAFVVHPITLNLEVWKTDRTGTLGAPLPVVKTWLGKESWTIFTNRL